MKSISLRTMVFLSALTWLVVGIFLLTLGMRLLTSKISNDHFSLVDYFNTLFGDRNDALIVLISLGLCVGYLKGRFVLKKTVGKQIKRLKTIQQPLHLGHLYTKKYLLLIGLMISLGFILRALPIHPDVRGLIDLTVGTALLFGASNYFRLV
jgi:hypothetical protein